MATYTITVRNQSGQTASYFVFQAPPVVTGHGAEPPAYANAWASLEDVADDAADSVVYAQADIAGGGDFTADLSRAPRFYVAEGDFTPGQVADPSQASNVATVDFSGRPQTTATVTQDAGGGFLVAYA